MKKINSTIVMGAFFAIMFLQIMASLFMRESRMEKEINRCRENHGTVMKAIVYPIKYYCIFDKPVYGINYSFEIE